jgi:hypothetical protein
LNVVAYNAHFLLIATVGTRNSIIFDFLVFFIGDRAYSKAFELEMKYVGGVKAARQCRVTLTVVAMKTNEPGLA